VSGVLWRGVLDGCYGAVVDVISYRQGHYEEWCYRLEVRCSLTDRLVRSGGMCGWRADTPPAAAQPWQLDYWRATAVRWAQADREAREQ
jgi:hypothetical protein